MSKSRWMAWFRQAEHDLDWAEATLERGFHAQACFVAQQVAEKALKALAFSRGADLVKSHSLVRIATDLFLSDEIRSKVRVLDLYYLATRYPDALPDSEVPHDQFDSRQAREAADAARFVLDFVRQALPQ